MNEAMEQKVNETVVETAEEIVVASSNGCLKKLGIVGGLVALGVAGYFMVKKFRNKEEIVIDDVDVDIEDVELLDEDIASDED